MAIDWGDGDYSRTAAELAPVADLVVGAVGVKDGWTFLDVGCGTGNAALAAARRGALVTGVDPSARLLQAARERAAAEGLVLELREGGAESLPVDDAAFDAVVSVFGVIFARDPERAAAELLRAVRPGGVVALTSWLREGPIHRVARRLMTALPDAPPPPGRWDEPGWIGALLSGAGAADVTTERHALAIRAASAEQWLADAEAHHPVWRWVRGRLAPADWEAVHEECLGILREGNEDATAFAVTSPYLLVRCGR